MRSLHFLLLLFAVTVPLYAAAQDQSSQVGQCEHLKAYLKLSKPQTEEIQKIAQEKSRETQAKQDQIDEILRKGEQKEPDGGEKVETLGAQIHRDRIEARTKMVGVLSENQRKKLDVLSEEKQPELAFEDAVKAGFLSTDQPEETFGGTTSIFKSDAYQKSKPKSAEKKKSAESDKIKEIPQPQ